MYFMPHVNTPEENRQEQMEGELESIARIINQEAKQRKLEHADECDPGHTIGICCDNCQGKMFTSFGVTREKRKDAPGYVTLVYLHCATCGEMILYVAQTTLFVNSFGGYIPHWNQDSQITRASLQHFAQLEEAAEESVKNLIDWM